jgi:hypothetical protein
MTRTTHFQLVAHAVKRAQAGQATPADTMLLLKHSELAKFMEDTFNRPKVIDEVQQAHRAKILALAKTL